MTKEKFITSAKIIIVAWLTFMIVDAVAYIIEVNNMTEQSGSYLEYVQQMKKAILEDNASWSDIQTIEVFKSSRLLGRVLLIGLRLIILLPWLLSIRAISKGKITKTPFIFLLSLALITIFATFGSLVMIPTAANEGTQNWITYTARLINYPIAICTTTWVIMWLNSPLRPTHTRQAKSIQEQRKQFKAL